MRRPYGSLITSEFSNQVIMASPSNGNEHSNQMFSQNRRKENRYSTKLIKVVEVDSPPQIDKNKEAILQKLKLEPAKPNLGMLAKVKESPRPEEIIEEELPSNSQPGEYRDHRHN